MTTPLTFLAVHAHPDDEASSTGGTFPLLAQQGVRTVLVTCTNGECGDDPQGQKPQDDGHDGEAVAALRRDELAAACDILSIDRLVMLGYRDSGMEGWPQNDDPRCFWRADVAEAASRLRALLEEERPQVVMTYNEIGFYGHPDHIQAHRVTLAALEGLSYEPTLYFNAIPSSVFAEWRRRRREAGEDIPEEGGPDFSTPDDLIDAFIDVSSTAERKFDALCAHASQIGEDSFWMQMGKERFVATMTTETFVRARNPLGLSEVVRDLFAGYR